MRRNNQFTVLFLSFLFFYFCGEAAASSLYRNNHYYNRENHVADYLDLDEYDDFEYENEIYDETTEEIIDENGFFQINLTQNEQKQVESDNYFNSKLSSQLRSNTFSLSPSNENYEHNVYSQDNEDEDNIKNKELLRRLNVYKLENNINYDLKSTTTSVSICYLILGFLVLFI